MIMKRYEGEVYSKLGLGAELGLRQAIFMTSRGRRTGRSW